MPPEMTAAGAERLVSPTGITNAIPRPRSPRRPDYRPGGPLLSAESFRRTYSSGKNPNVRRRSHDEMGHFGDQPRMCAPMDFLNLTGIQNTKRGAAAGGCVDTSRTYAERYGPGAKRNFGVCVHQTNYAAGKAGLGISEFAMTAAEVYRQECKSDNRGADQMFFTDQEGQVDDNSLMGDSSSTSDILEGRDSKSVSPARSRRKGEPGNVAGTRSRQFPNAIHITKDSKGVEISPPRVDRMNTKEFDPSEYCGARISPDNHGELREARMQLFKMGQTGEMSEPESRLKMALQDLERQDGTIEGLKKQLRMSQKALDDKVDELRKAQSWAQEKQYKATEIRARSVQDRKRLEDMYEKELEQNKKLESMVSTLQVEVSSLKVSLRNARSGLKHGDSGRNPSSPSHSKSESAQLISLRAEIVDLRSQLAEAKAANLEDTSSLNSTFNTIEAEDLKKKLEEAEVDLLDLREKASSFEKLEDKHLEIEKQLKRQLESQKVASDEMKSKLESTLKDARAAEKKATTELVKCKASMQRLERERSRSRLHSSADVDRINRQLSKAREETAKAKKQLDDERVSSKASIAKLKSEVDDLRKKIIKENKSDVTKGTENLKDRRRSQQSIARLTQETRKLRDELKTKDEKIGSLTSTVAKLEEDVKKAAVGQSQVVETSLKKQVSDGILDSSLMETEIKLLKANEATLRHELKLKEGQLEEARKLSAKQNSSAERTNSDDLRRQLELFKSSSISIRDSKTIVTVLQEEISGLKKRLAAAEAKARAAPGGRPEGRLKAMEQAYTNQVAVLKSRLTEQELKCKEEAFRADEERRISREKDTERSQALEKLRKEKEAVLQENNNLEDTVIELRKKLAMSVSQVGRPLASAVPAGESDTKADAPKNLTRLRNELALARARLTAARDQSQSLHSRSLGQSETTDVLSTNESLIEKAMADISYDLPDSPERSVDSGESSWAPPKIMTASSQGSQQDGIRLASPPDLTTVSGMEKSSFSPLSLHRSVSFDLQEQIDASNRRLEEANSRLKNLVVRPDFPQMGSNGMKNRSSYVSGRQPLRPIITLDDASETSGVMNEVMSSASGNIEVSHLRFADV